LKIEELMKQPAQDNPLAHQLKVSDRLFWKVWLLSPRVRLLGGIAGLLLVYLLIRLIWRLWPETAVSFSWGELITFAVALALGVFIFEKLSGVLNYRKTLDQILIGVGLMFGSLLAKLHLYVFDKIFLRQGSIERLLGRKRK
jgi:hypothetical protein